MGSQRAAWNASYQAERAKHCDEDYAQSLLDLVKAFETVDHGLLIQAAKHHGYNPWVLRLSLQAYRAPRRIGIEGVYSRLITAGRGITAGSGFATTELRVLLLSLVDAAYKLYKGIDFKYFVDDASIENRGRKNGNVHTRNSCATGFVVDYFQKKLRMDVSASKSCVVASKLSVAELTSAAGYTDKIKPVGQAKLLGVWGCGGRRRCTKGQQERLSTVVEKTDRVHSLRRAGVCTKHLVKTTYVPAALHEVHCMGVSPSHLGRVRRAVAKATAPPTSGKNFELILYMADTDGGCLDPAFEAHGLPITFYANAWWETWRSHDDLAEAHKDATDDLMKAKGSIWQKVTGPIGGAIASMWRLGWTFQSARQVRTDRGRVLDFILDSPAAVRKEVFESVRRWRLARIIAAHPMLKPSYTTYMMPAVSELPPRGFDKRDWLPPDWHDLPWSIGKLLFGRKSSVKSVPQWSRACRPWLTSALTGGQWTQARLYGTKRGWTDTDRCQLCGAAAGTVAHRRKCSITAPAGGWPKHTEAGQKYIDQMTPSARSFLQNTGMGVIRVKTDKDDIEEEVRWHMTMSDLVEQEKVTWYVDGSLLDGPRTLTSSTGAGFAGVDPQGILVAYGDATPPNWITTIPGVEAWIVQVILSATTVQKAIVTDCLGNVNTFEKGMEYATGAKRVLARIWQPIMEIAAERHIKLIWMPAHTTTASVGIRRKSDGRVLTPIDHRANALVDVLAKKAATLVKMPSYVLDLVLQAEAAFEHEAALLGVVTRTANGLGSSDKNYCEAGSDQTKRDSMPSSMLARSGARRDQKARREAELARKAAESKVRAEAQEAARKEERSRRFEQELVDLQRRQDTAVELSAACAQEFQIFDDTSDDGSSFSLDSEMKPASPARHDGAIQDDEELFEPVPMPMVMPDPGMLSRQRYTRKTAYRGGKEASVGAAASEVRTPQQLNSQQQNAKGPSESG